MMRLASDQGSVEPISRHIKLLKEKVISQNLDQQSAAPINPDSGGEPALQPVRCRRVHFAASIFRPETIPGALFSLTYSAHELGASAQGLSANVPGERK